MNSRELLSALGERLGWTVLHSLWQGAAIAVILVITLVALRRRSAAARHAACLLALIVLLGTACTTALWTSIRRTPTPTPATSSRPSEKSVVSIGQSTQSTVVAWPPLGEVETTEPAAAGPIPGPGSIASWQDHLRPYLPWIAAGWVCGVALLSLRHLGGWCRVRSWRRRGADVDPATASIFAQLQIQFRLQGKVWLRQSASALAPMLTGVLRPIVILPARLLTGLSSEQLHAVLAHELAHLARRDTWSNFLQVIIETIFFYHPALWWMSRRARIEREHAADDLALRVCSDRRQYAGALARLAELQSAPTVALAANGGSLLQRIRRIILPTPREPATPGWTLPTLAAVAAMLVALLAHVGADDPKVVVVKPGESIQKAIDAAPAGAVIRLEAGMWKERIILSKPLTVEGAGWEKTRIQPDQPVEGVTPEGKAEFRKRFVRGLPETEVAKLNREWAEKFEPPTLLVHNCEKVAVRGIRFGGVLPASRDAAGDDTLVVLRNAQASLIGCAIVGPFGNGVKVLDRSELEIQQSLIAALWGEGIIVQGMGRDDGSQPSRLRLVESEVRNVYHYGVVMGSGCDSTTIDRCRISGTAWHGVRYDHASPTITNNVIYQNARSGIYASGKTAAVVRNNVFWKNEMSGISCWLSNADLIENNTFIENRREGLAVIGGSKPTVARNTFASNPVAIAYAMTQGSTSPPEPILTGNLFWKNESELREKGESKAAPPDSVKTDPQFRDAGKQDFKASTSIGAATPLSPISPTPLLDEEKAIIPADDTREFSSWTESGAPKKSKAAADAAAKSATDAQAWTEDAFQLDNAEKRIAAIERIRAAMRSGKLDETRTGITAFVRLAPIEFDKASFRPMVRELLNSPDIPTRAQALNGFTLTGTESEDLVRIFALADDPAAEVRENLAYVIVQVTKHDLTDRAASAAILKLMAKLPRDPRSVAHALWGCKLSPEIEAKALEFCRDMQGAGGAGYDFFYGTLSTQANKSEASCKRLIELLAHQDTTNIAGRSAWGLQQGVDRAQYALVADAMMRVIEARSDGYLRRNALSCLGSYGNATQVPALKALLAKPGVTGDFRTACEKTLATIEQRR
jgi:parallel beta-helix repeat protein